MKSTPWQQLATAPRKSYLGKKQLITPLQRTWIRSMLCLWGEKYGGHVGPEVQKTSVIGRLMLRTEWNDNQQKRILLVVDSLYQQGYRGNILFLKAKEILYPENTLNQILNNAINKEDADFIETVVIKTFATNNPIRVVAIQRYCEHRNAQQLAAYLSRFTGIDIESARRRIRWCEELFEAAIFHAVMLEMENKKL